MPKTPKTPRPSPARLKAAKAVLPMSWLREHARSLLAAGQTAKEVAQNISEIVDRLLDCKRLLPAPWGWIAEEADGPLAYAIALPLVRGAERAMKKAGLLA